MSMLRSVVTRFRASPSREIVSVPRVRGLAAVVDWTGIGFVTRVMLLISVSFRF